MLFYLNIFEYSYDELQFMCKYFLRNCWSNFSVEMNLNNYDGQISYKILIYSFWPYPSKYIDISPSNARNLLRKFYTHFIAIHKSL